MKWVAIALALLLLASGVFWLGRNSSPSLPSEAQPAASAPQAAKPSAPETPAPQAGANPAPMDAAPQEPPPAAPPKPKTLAELDTGTLIQRAISADDRCSNGGGNLDQTGAACAMRDQVEAILNARGFCHSSGSADWRPCGQ